MAANFGTISFVNSKYLQTKCRQKSSKSDNKIALFEIPESFPPKGYCFQFQKDRGDKGYYLCLTCRAAKREAKKADQADVGAVKMIHVRKNS